MTDIKRELLGKLQSAKAEVVRLEAEYRKNCECNEYIGGVKPDMTQENVYNKIYKTCEYHKVRMYHYA